MAENEEEVNKELRKMSAPFSPEMSGLFMKTLMITNFRFVDWKMIYPNALIFFRKNGKLLIYLTHFISVESYKYDL